MNPLSFFAVVEPPDRAGVRHEPITFSPDLMKMYVAEHKGRGFGTKQRCGELVVESGHRHAVLGHTTGDGAVRDAYGCDSRRARLSVHHAPSTKQRRARPACRFGRAGGTDRRRDVGFVHGRQARENGQRVLRNSIESPSARFRPATVACERHLLNSVCDVDRMACGESAKNIERARRLMRVGPLEKQHRAMSCKLLDPTCQRFDRGSVQFERVIGRVTRDHRRINVGLNRAADRVAEAAIDLTQCVCRVVQIRELRDQHGSPHGSANGTMLCSPNGTRGWVALSPQATTPSSTSTAASKPPRLLLNASTALTTRLIPLGLRFQPAPYFFLA
jgi:hypothetical protein